jgi:hypothetical protein
LTGRERVIAMLDGRRVDHLPLMPITMMFAADRIRMCVRWRNTPCPTAPTPNDGRAGMKTKNTSVAEPAKAQINDVRASVRAIERGA